MPRCVSLKNVLRKMKKRSREIGTGNDAFVQCNKLCDKVGV